MYLKTKIQKIYRRIWLREKDWLRRHGFFENLMHLSAGALTIACIVAVGLSVIPRARAYGSAYSATDDIGQTDSSLTTANLNTSSRDNTPINNATGINGAQGVAIDSVNHRLFVADKGNGRIMIYNLDANDNFMSTQPDNVLGEIDLTTYVGAQESNYCFTDSQKNFCGPVSLVYDSTSQRLFVADNALGQILIFDLSGGITNNMSASYELGLPSFGAAAYGPNQCEIYQPASQSDLCDVRGIAYDPVGQRLFVADRQYGRIMEWDLSGGITSGMNAAHELGEPDFTSLDNNPYGCWPTHRTPTATNMCNPTAVAYDTTTQTLFVADTGENRVLTFDLSGGITDDMAASHSMGNGTNCSDSDTCYGANGLTYDTSTKKLYISDFDEPFGGGGSSSDRLLVVDMSGGITDDMAATNVLGATGFTDADRIYPTASGDAAQNGLAPGQVAIDSSKQILFVADTYANRILRFDLSGGITNGMNADAEVGQTIYNTTTPSFTLHGVNNANPSPAGLDNPTGVTEDPVHHLLFQADQNNNRVLVYVLDSTNHLQSHSANYELGQASFNDSTSNCVANTPSGYSQSSLCQPEGVAVDTGRQLLFVTDYGGNRVMVFDYSGGITSGMNASHELGQPNFTTATTSQTCNLTPTDSNMCAPNGLAYDATDQELFVADPGNNRILGYDLSGTITDGMAANHVLGQPGFDTNSPNNGGVSATSVNNPRGLSYDSGTQQLYASDSANNRVLIYDLSGGISDDMPAVHVLGQINFSNNGGAITAGGMADPVGLSIDPTNGRLFVSDTAANRVLEYSTVNGITDGMSAILEIGQSDFVSGGRTGPNAAGLATQFGLAIGSGVFPGVFYDGASQKLYVSDPADNRTTVYDIGPTILTTDLPNGSLNTVYSSSISVQDGLGNLTFAVTGGSFPAGLTLDSSSGIISGTPTVRGNYNFTVQVTDQLGEVGIQGYSVEIGGYLASDLLQQQGQAAQPDFTQGLARANGLSTPTGTAVDSVHHRLFVGDGNRVLVFNLNTNGTLPDHTADFVLGQSDFTDNDCNLKTMPYWETQTPPGSSTLCSVTRVIYDNAHNRLFVDDSANNRVVVYDFSGGITTGMSASYVIGQKDFTSNGCPDGLETGSSNVLCSASDMTYDALNQRLFVIDWQNTRVSIFDLSGGITSGMSEVSEIGASNTVSIAIDPARQLLFFLGYNGGIYDEDLSGGINDPVFGNAVVGNSGAFCSDPGGFGHPDAGSLCDAESITYDPTNQYLFAGDSGNGRITVYDLSGGVSDGMNAFLELGEPDMNTFDEETTASGLGQPTFVAFDAASGRVYATDSFNDRIMTYDISAGGTSGQAAENVIGQTDANDNPVFTTNDANNAGGNTSDSSLIDPTATVLDSVHHRLFVIDRTNDNGSPYDGFSNGRVLVYNLDSDNNLTSHSASYVLGQSDFTSTDDSDSQATFCPDTLAYSPDNNYLFVGDDCLDSVDVFDLSGGISNGMEFTTSIYTGMPAGLAYDDVNNRLFVSNNTANEVDVYDFSGGLDNIAQINTIGAGDFGENIGVAYDDSTQKLYVTDDMDSQIDVFDLSGGISDDVGISNQLGDGTFGFCWGDTPTDGTQSSLCAPEGSVSIDPANHRLFVVDNGSDRLLVYDTGALTDGEPASGLIGQIDFSSSNTGDSQSQINLNSQSCESECDPASWHNFDSPAYDPDNNRLYLPDNNNDRVMLFNLARITTNSLSDAPVNSAYSQTVDHTGTQGDVSYSLQSGSLPAGINLDSSSGLLSGTPTAAGTYNFIVGLADDNGSNGIFTDSKVLSLSVDAGSTPPATPPSTPPSTPPKEPATPETPTSPPVVPPPVDIDNSPPATTTDACSGVTSASAGQVFSFTSADGTNHKITILQVGTDTVEIQVDNLPRTLHVGELIDQDVNNDGTPDVCVDVLGISDGTVQLDIAKIVLAIAPGGHKNTGIGAGTGSGTPAAAPPKHHVIPKVILLVFPWLLFILLGVSVVRLVYLALQERRFATGVAKELAEEKALAEEKQNFITLSSHYLRTPMSLISNGIDLMATLDSNNPEMNELEQLSHQLGDGVNRLLASVENTEPALGAQPDNSGGSLFGRLAPLAAGFAQISTMPAIAAAMAGTLVVIGITDLTLSKVDKYTVSTPTLLIQLAGLVLVGTLLAASLRRYHKNKELSGQAAALLAHQRQLEAERNQLVKGSLDSLNPPLSQLKAKLITLSPANPKAAKAALDGANRLGGILNRFTILTSLQGGTMNILRQPVDLTALVNQISQRYAPTMRERGITLRTELVITQLDQDPLLLNFVIDSLVNNAVKYSPANQEISLISRQNGKQVEIQVGDHGAGIPEIKRAQLFQPFSRAENVAADFNQEGTGLSLYLDKLIMRYLGGTISLESGNEGTTIGVSLPAA